MKHETYRGKVVYRSDTLGERGREWFTVTKHGGGHRTIRSFVEVLNTGLVRDVTYTVNDNWQPVDAFVRLTENDEFMGSGWFRFTGEYAECETYTADAGRISQRMKLNGLPPSFGPHPVACDVWHIGAFDMDSGIRIQTIKGTLMSSPRPDGASGPFLSRTVLETGGVSTDEFRIEYVGPETVTVEAGTFETDHFRFLLGEESIPEDIWCLPEDLIIVKVRFDVMATTYELVDLEG